MSRYDFFSGLSGRNVFGKLAWCILICILFSFALVWDLLLVPVERVAGLRPPKSIILSGCLSPLLITLFAFACWVGLVVVADSFESVTSATSAHTITVSISAHLIGPLSILQNFKKMLTVSLCLSNFRSCLLVPVLSLHIFCQV